MSYMALRLALAGRPSAAEQLCYMCYAAFEKSVRHIDLEASPGDMPLRRADPQ